MSFLIGTDEAGYGPNLGPLTVTGTLWKTDTPGVDLYQSLAETVTNEAKFVGKSGAKIFVADSKKVYASTGSIQNLETCVLAIVYAATNQVPNEWMELVELVCPPATIKHLPAQIWLSGQNLGLPAKADIDQIQRLGDQFRESCDVAGVELLELQCVPVFPPQFNSQVERLGNKATLLSTETLHLVRRLMDRSDDDVEIGCDKHGGRSRYGALIQACLTDEFVMVGRESLEVSDYSFRENDRDVFIRFQARGESFLPTALASMVSKYVREVFMMLWNDFWKLKIPDIKPTKGYPVDARRFKNEIATMQRKLEIDDHLIWRNR